MFWFEFFGILEIMVTRINTPKSLFGVDLILMFFILINILFYPQAAFYCWSAVCILLPVCSLQPAFYTDRCGITLVSNQQNISHLVSYM